MLFMQCLRCGYDLRGSDHVRCPECGTAVATATYYFRKRLEKRSWWWVFATGTVIPVAMISYVYQIGQGDGNPQFDHTLALLMFFVATLILVQVGAGYLISFAQQDAIRRLERAFWNRSCIWLHIDWFLCGFLIDAVEPGSLFFLCLILLPLPLLLACMTHMVLQCRHGQMQTARLFLYALPAILMLGLQWIFVGISLAAYIGGE
jgi:hypothetical protein